MAYNIILTGFVSSCSHTDLIFFNTDGAIELFVLWPFFPGFTLIPLTTISNHGIKMMTSMC